MSTLGTAERPLRVAIIGAGPSGFYAADPLLKGDVVCTVDMFDRLPTPFGLVRGGVAPDHPKIRTVTKVYEKIADRPGFRFFGNVKIGRDLSVEELRQHYDAILFTCGAETDRRMGIPGEDLPGSYTATSFVGWYNAHPDYRNLEFDLSQESAAIIGVGNVAMDVARILAQTTDEMKDTDIAAHALETLSQSNIKTIYIIARRGAAQVKYTLPEIKEMGELADCEPVIDPTELELNDASQAELEEGQMKRIIEVMNEFSQRQADAAKSRRIHFKFLLSPVEIQGEGRAQKLVLEKNALEGEAGNQRAKGTGEKVTLDCGLVFRSIGYKGIAIPGVPFDERGGVFPNVAGRITENGAPVSGLYAAGWIKRGPSGVIGTNKPDAVETVNALLADAPSLSPCTTPDSDAVAKLLTERGVRIVTWGDWRKIDQAEIANGTPAGKPRERFTRISEMLKVLE